MNREIRFGIIGLGLMGREFASAVSRWCHLLDDSLPRPVIKGICDKADNDTGKWFLKHFPEIEVNTSDYRELIASDKIDAVYCAVPHNLHRQIYCDIIRAGKHLLGEKPFGVDLESNKAILAEAEKKPELIIRCASEFPFFPGSKRVIDWLGQKKYGRLMEVRAGFHHSSDMDLSKLINWKRMASVNGDYGCMGDLGFHIHFIPLRMGWQIKSVTADLQKIVETRKDKSGADIQCDTWDNAVVTCKAIDPATQKEFSLVLETKRMAPGQTNTWFIEAYGINGSVRFSTHDPKAFYSLETSGSEQGWTRTDIGYQSFIPTVTGSIFEFGFSDSILQMVGAFVKEVAGGTPSFAAATPAETNISHKIMTAALESHRTHRTIEI